MSELTYLLVIIIWLAGVVIAKGFWMTVFALFLPYALYLVVEAVLVANGVAV